MIIISQNKKSVYNFGNIKSIDVLENEIYVSDDILSDRGVCIAKYKTPERAEAVLEEIIYSYRYINNDTYFVVYEMPEE